MPTRGGTNTGSGVPDGRNRAAANAQRRASAGERRFVINLCSSMSPFTKSDLPNLPILKRHSVFTTHTVEEGRDRYRLHLGTFRTEADALLTLSKIRRSFPTAWVVQTSAHSSKLPKPEPLPKPGVRHSEHGRKPDAVGQGSASLLATGRVAPGKGESRIVETGTGSFYAVHLKWSRRPFDRHLIPELPLLKSHKLYAVEAQEQGKHWYGLRLGFFPSKGPAEKVARGLKREFNKPRVEEITSTEHALAISAFDPMSTTISLRRPEGLPGTHSVSADEAFPKSGPQKPAGVKRSHRPGQAKAAQRVTADTNRTPDPASTSGRFSLRELKRREGVTKLPLSGKGQSVARRLFEKLRSKVLQRTGTE